MHFFVYNDGRMNVSNGATNLQYINAQKAAAWLLTHARPLEQARYRYHFEDSTAEAILTVLSHFQNNDGGFGHGLESDVRLPDSSVICTTVALQIMREVKTPSEHPMVQGALNYLLAEQAADGTWRSVPDNVSDAPHAPWWTAAGEHVHDNIGNPSAEIVGFFIEHSVALQHRIDGKVLAYLEQQSAVNAIEMHEILCYQRLLESPNLHPDIRTTIVSHLKPAIEPLLIEPGSGAYGLLPLDVASHPDSPFTEMMGERVAADLAHRVTQQHEDGYWQPAWSWESEAWKTAEQEIRGVLTLNNLLIFKRYNR